MVYQCSYPDCDKESDSEKGINIHETKSHIQEQPWNDTERLKTLYFEKEMSYEEVGDEIGCSWSKVKESLKKNCSNSFPHQCPDCNKGFEEVKYLDSHHTREHKEHPWDGEEHLESLYTEKEMSTNEIADRLETNQNKVSYWLHKYGINVRTNVQGAILSNQNQQAAFRTNYNGYEEWREQKDGRQETVKVHRLLAVSKFGFDEVCDNIVHHGPITIPWANWEENIHIVKDRKEHYDIHDDHGYPVK